MVQRVRQPAADCEVAVSEVAREREKIINLLNSGIFHLKAVARGARVDPSTIYRLKESGSCTVSSLTRLADYFQRVKEWLP
jgi:hypothetical protein